MRLKQIKLAGFKSFVDSTKIPFLDSVTAIVGPNGCGKSNTIDAVRWVLGESSAKNLRGSAMTDVIFNGSTARQAISVASVELVFENLDGRIGGQYASYREIAIKRQVTRDAENTYFLNGVKCRRKDIADVFMGTGLGPRSYAIIEQGTISRLIESKPQDLRIFIEEAAGISRYKERRKDTENRIRHTRENLLRLNDIRVELGNQLERLEEQAKSAKSYRDYKDQERRTHAELLVMRYQDLLTKTDGITTDISAQELEMSKLDGAREKISTEIVQQKLSLQSLETEEQNHVEVFYQTGTKIARIEEQLVNEQQKDDVSQQSLHKIEQQLEMQMQKRQELVSKKTDLGKNLEPLPLELEVLQETIEELDCKITQSEEQLEGTNQELEEAKQLLNNTRLEIGLANNKTEFSEQSLSQKKQLLVEVEQQIEELNSSSDEQLLNQLVDKIKQISVTKENEEKTHQTDSLSLQKLKQQISELNALQSNKQQQQAALDARLELISHWIETANKQDGLQVWQSIQVQSGWESAFELLFGNTLLLPVIPPNENLAVDVPNEDIKPNQKIGFSIFNDVQHYPLLTSKVNLAPWMDGVHFVENKAQAEALLGTISINERIITADGFMLGHGFVLQQVNSESSILQLKAEKQELSHALKEISEQNDQRAKQLYALSENFNTLEKSIFERQKLISDLVLELSHLQQEKKNLELSRQKQKQIVDKLQVKKNNLSNEINKLMSDISLYNDKSSAIHIDKEALETKVAVMTESFQENKNQAQMLRFQLKDSEQKIAQLRSSQNDLQTHFALSVQELTQVENQIKQLQESKNDLVNTKDSQNNQNNLNKLKQSLSSLLDEQGSQQQHLDKLRQQQQECKQSLNAYLLQQKQEVGRIEKIVKSIASLKLRRESLKGQIDSQVQLLTESQVNVQQVVKMLQPDADINVWQQRLEALKANINNLGAINLAAIEEYEQQNERKQYLDSQNDDLNLALQSLEQAIRKIDKETKIRFKSTFEQINNDFMQLFPKVFGGGKAYLALTEDDLLEAGVSIMAQPPGKKNSTIHLLSGGEKALTALSLVFAIFQLNPAPFCMLDEVDAPLDDANVERFCRLLKEMSQTVQFIYISHNKITMEMADQLIGVTMHEPGVSRIVAVNIEEAVAMADAV